MTPLRWIVIAGALLWAATAHAHEWYSDKHNPATNNMCCGGSDCRVLELDQWSITPFGLTVLWIDGKSYSLPLDQVLPTEDKQGRAAACVWGGKMRCGFMPLSY